VTPSLITGRLRPSSLNRRLVLFALLSALPALAVVVIQFASDVRRLPSESAENVQAVTQRVSAQVQSLLVSVEGTVEVMGILGIDSLLDTQRCSQALQRAVKSVDNVLNLSLVTPGGKIFCSAVPVPPAVRVDDRPYFQEALATRKVALSGYTVGRVTRREAIQMAVPVLSSAGDIQALAIAAINPAGLTGAMDGGKLDLRALVLDHDGVLLSLSSPGQNLERGRSYADSPLFAMLKAGKSGTHQGLGLDGQTRLFNLAAVNFADKPVFYVATGVDLAQIEKTALTRALSYGLLVLLTGAMVSLIAQLAIRPVVLERTRPLLKVASSAVEGRYNERVPVEVKDELTPIEVAVNTMLASVESDRARVVMLSERNALIAQATNDIIYDWNAITGDFWCNRLSARAPGSTTSSPIGSMDEWFGFMHAEDSGRVRTLWHEAIDSGAEYCEFRYRVKRTQASVQDPIDADSTEVIFMLERAHLMRNSSGTLVRVVSGARDVTEQTLSELSLRQSEQQVRQLNETLESRVRQRTAQYETANRELESFSYSVSHDLRAPLNTIDGFSKLLGTSIARAGDEQAAHYLRRIRAGVKFMGELIEGLLSLSKLSRDEMKDEVVNLSALARMAAQVLSESDPQRQVEVVIEESLLARGDARLLKAVMDNLIGNAFKFTSKTDHAKIHVGRTSGPGREAAFFVQDNGAGFDMAFAHKLFGTFERLHTESEFPGSGIGLATVKRIVQRHGGRVWAESDGQGATFFFALGMHQPDPA
jgi:signal transduction histidine kinase/HAMP domain-containing protein